MVSVVVSGFTFRVTRTIPCLPDTWRPILHQAGRLALTFLGAKADALSLRRNVIFRSWLCQPSLRSNFGHSSGFLRPCSLRVIVGGFVGRANHLLQPTEPYGLDG